MKNSDSLPLKPVRRIVTALTEDGRSFVAEDGESPAQTTIDERPGYRVTNLWRTLPGGTVRAPDSILDHEGVLPPVGGTVIRMIDWPPEPSDPGELRALMDRTFARMFPDAHRDIKDGEHPGMHTTRTIDYAVVMEGEIVALMDEGETVMRAGDVLIQRGTPHAWANRSGRAARVLFVLTDCA